MNMTAHVVSSDGALLVLVTIAVVCVWAYAALDAAQRDTTCIMSQDISS